MLIDTCHLDFKDFAEEREDIIQRTVIAGVRQMITIYRVKKFDQIKELAERHERVFCSESGSIRTTRMKSPT